MAFIKWSFGDTRRYPNIVSKWPEFEFSDKWLIDHKSDFLFDSTFAHDNSLHFSIPCENMESGIYLLFRNGKVSYVGQAVNLRDRLEKHSDRLFGKGKYYSSYFTISVPYHFLDDVECHYIKTLNPPDNIAKGRGGFMFK